MNKRGWIKIIEASIAILLIMSVVILILERDYNERNDVSAKIYSVQISILEELVSNSVDKRNILREDEELVNIKINSRTPDYLDCKAVICDIGNDCSLDEDKENIYVQSIIVEEDEDIKKQLSLYCWT